MPTIKPKEKRSGPRKKSAEVQDFYRDRSKHGRKELKVDHLHKRHKTLIEKIVNVWSEDREKSGKLFTGFQNRIIELHNQKTFGKDPEDAKRLLAFLTVFGENEYGDDEIKLLSNGTFKNQEEIDDLLTRAYAGEKKWKAGYGKASLHRESDEYNLAILARERIGKDQILFRAATMPQGQIGIARRLSLQLAVHNKFFGHLGEFRTELEGKEMAGTAPGGATEKFARFDLENISAAGTKELLGFIEAGTSSNIEKLLKDEAKNKVSKKTDQISQAESKGYKGIAKACDKKHLKKLRKEGLNRHEDVVSGFSNLEDFLKYVHPDLSFTEGSKLEALLAVGLNDPATLELINTHLNGTVGTPLESSPEKILSVIKGLTEPEQTTLADNLERDAVDQLQQGPWYLKVDAAHTFLERRLDQITDEGEILPKVEFDKLNLKDATYHHAAVLLAHGYREAQLTAQKMDKDKIKQAIKTYFVHDEDGKLIFDAAGKPQFKESQTPDDYKDDIQAKRDAIDLDDIKDEYKDDLGEDDEDVLKHYLVKATVEARRESIARLTADEHPISEANIQVYLPTFLSKYWINDLPVTDATNPNHNTWLTSSKDLTLRGKKTKKKVKKLHNQKMDQAEKQHKRENIIDAELAELGTVQLAGLKENPSASTLDADALPEPTKTEVENIESPDDFPTGNIDQLKDFIAANPHLSHGIDLSILFAMFDAIPQAEITSELNDDQQQQLKQTVA